jgi:hypothetical protein
MATEEHPKPYDHDTVTYMNGYDYTDGSNTCCMVKPINNHIGQSYYSVQSATSQKDFSNMIGRNILDNQHPLITGIVTKSSMYALNMYALKGWDQYPTTNHIITIYGFDFSSPDIGYVYYYETASTHAGEKEGPGPKVLEYNAFWSLVQELNIQLAR